MVRSTVRALLALLLIGTFGARAAAPGALWACTMPTAGDHTSHGHHSGNHGPVPGSDAPVCECVAHSSAVANFSTPCHRAPSEVSYRVVSIVAEAARAPDPLPRYLLPFAQAPPAVLG